MTDTNVLNPSMDKSAEKLEEAMRGELSAVETYDLALKSVNEEPVRRTLQELRDNHARRVEQVRERMVRLGLTPPTSSGAWGAFAKTVQAGADLLGQTAALAALEEGEDHGIRSYTTDLDDLTADTRLFITNTLLPEQQKSHNLCKTLQEAVKRTS